MAFAPEQDQQNQQGQTQNPAIQPTTSSAPGAGPGATSAKAATPQSAPAQPFQNLQSYLTANAPQVQTQANQIAGNLNNQYGQVQGDINNAQSNFNNQVNSGYAQDTSGLASQAASNPSAFVSNPSNVAAFQSLYNDTYTGPGSFEGSTPYGALNTEVSNAQNTASNFNTLPGMQTYFQGQNPNATQGGNTLDAVLLSSNPQAYQTIQNAAQPFSNLNSYLTNATTAADQNVSKANTAAQNETQAVQNQFTGIGGVVPTFNANVNNELQTDISQTNAYNKAINDLINQEGNANNQIGGLKTAVDAYNQALASDKGMSNITGSPINLETINNPQLMTQPTLAQAATPQDIATENALAQLLGPNFTPSFNAQGATPFTSPGTAPTLQGIVDPILANLQGQATTANPNVFLKGTGNVGQNVNYVQNMNNAIQSLKQYLGEPYVLPGSPQDNRAGQTAQAPGQTVF